MESQDSKTAAAALVIAFAARGLSVLTNTGSGTGHEPTDLAYDVSRLGDNGQGRTLLAGAGVPGKRELCLAFGQWRGFFKRVLTPAVKARNPGRM